MCHAFKSFFMGTIGGGGYLTASSIITSCLADTSHQPRKSSHLNNSSTWIIMDQQFSIVRFFLFLLKNFRFFISLNNPSHCIHRGLILSIQKSSLQGSCKLPQKCWARSVRLFWYLLDRKDGKTYIYIYEYIWIYIYVDSWKLFLCKIFYFSTQFSIYLFQTISFNN